MKSIPLDPIFCALDQPEWTYVRGDICKPKPLPPGVSCTTLELNVNGVAVRDFDFPTDVYVRIRKVI